MRALVTGASSGIGRDMAIYLDKLGFDVVLVSRDKEKLEKVKDELKGKTEIVPMDLSNSENCKELYNKVKDIDILVNNAGFGTFGSFDETDLDKEIDLIDTNVKAMHILAKLYLKDMLQKDKGHILNVASIAGFMPGPLMSAYYASKAYVVRVSEGIREELRKKKSNVKISVLCPGPVDTNFNDVAGVRFKLPSYSSNHVAKYAIDKMLRNKFIIVPGLKIKMVRFLAKISPNNVTSKIVYMMQERKR